MRVQSLARRFITQLRHAQPLRQLANRGLGGVSVRRRKREGVSLWNKFQRARRASLQLEDAADAAEAARLIAEATEMAKQGTVVIEVWSTWRIWWRSRRLGTPGPIWGSYPTIRCDAFCLEADR